MVLVWTSLDRRGKNLLLLCEKQLQKGVLAFGDGFSVDRARVVTKECCKVPPVFLHSSCCCGWAQLKLLSAAEEAELPTCQEVKVELIKTGNDLNLFWLNPFSNSKPQRAEAKLWVGARPRLCCHSEVAVTQLRGFGRAFPSLTGGCWCFLLGARLGNAHLSLAWIPAELGSSWGSQQSPDPALASGLPRHSSS